MSSFLKWANLKHGEGNQKPTTYLKLCIHLANVNYLQSGLSKLASFLCHEGQQSLMRSGLNLPSNNHFSGTTEFLLAFSAFFHSGLATHLDIGRCGLIDMTDLIFSWEIAILVTCLFIDFTYFST